MPCDPCFTVRPREGGMQKHDGHIRAAKDTEGLPKECEEKQGKQGKRTVGKYRCTNTTIRGVCCQEAKR